MMILSWYKERLQLLKLSWKILLSMYLIMLQPGHSTESLKAVRERNQGNRPLKNLGFICRKRRMGFILILYERYSCYDSNGTQRRRSRVFRFILKLKPFRLAFPYRFASPNTLINHKQKSPDSKAHCPVRGDHHNYPSQYCRPWTNSYGNHLDCCSRTQYPGHWPHHLSSRWRHLLLRG